MRFEPHCDVPDIVKTVPHVAFVVRIWLRHFKKTDSDRPNQPSPGVRVAFILDDGAPVELLEFVKVDTDRPRGKHAAEHRAAPDRRR